MSMPALFLLLHVECMTISKLRSMFKLKIRKMMIPQCHT